MEDHPSPIVKGKRTKRQRPQSPVPFELATSSPTPASSAEIFSTTTEEEEDMANCLILLAQGHEYRKPVRPDTDIDYHNQQRHNHINKYYDDSVGSSKFTSRRYLETATSNGSRAGYYVYECKTCNRTFPSFQALGGHRASHKKPKNSHLNNNICSTNLESLTLPAPSNTMVKRQMLALLPSASDDEGRFCKISSLSLQLGSHHNVCSSSFNRNNSHNAKHANSKVHECSICGAEFASGQALGGHMRRHRATTVGISNPNPIPSSSAAITTLSLTPLSTFQAAEDIPPSTPVVIDQAKVNNNNINLSLDLDLNLPASTQDHQHSDGHRHRDDHQESRSLGKFPALMNTLISPSSSAQQQIELKSQSSNKSSMVFSASPALVDCHY